MGRPQARRRGSPLRRPRIRKLGTLAFRKHERGLPKFAAIENATPDATLAALRVPTLVVLGGRSELHHADRVAERTQRLIPDVHVHILRAASHALPVTKAAVVGPMLRSFLDQQEQLHHHSR